MSPVRAMLTWRLAAMVGTIAALHIAGFALLFSAPTAGGRSMLGIGIGLTAYTLGMRHAFDADHIAAIDNTTRKLVTDHREPVSVGFWFSLGHSTIVFALTFLLALGVHSLIGPVQQSSSTLHQVTGTVGTAVSGSFLYLIAAINLVLLITALRRRRGARTDGEDTTAPIGPTGLLTRVFGGLTRSLRSPWQMYPVGILFGLGFDTATEVGLLVLAASSTAAGVPWYALLSLPLLFTAGMSLLDTADGLLMRVAYGWAFIEPGRKFAYNLTVTVLSITVAAVVGTVELLSLLASELHVAGGFWDWVRSIDLNTAGFALVGAFVAVWGVALILRRRRRLSGHPD
jgi:high-affinity nickel-transport protein